MAYVCIINPMKDVDLFKPPIQYQTLQRIKNAIRRKDRIGRGFCYRHAALS